jgi:hypothetical protein
MNKEGIWIGRSVFTWICLAAKESKWRRKVEVTVILFRIEDAKVSEIGNDSGGAHGGPATKRGWRKFVQITRNRGRRRTWNGKVLLFVPLVMRWRGGGNSNSNRLAHLMAQYSHHQPNKVWLEEIPNQRKLLFRPPKFARRPLVVTKMPLKKHFVAYKTKELNFVS